MTMAMAMVARAMAATTRVVGKQQQGQWRQQWLWQTTMRAMATAMRVVSDKKGEGGKAMATVTISEEPIRDLVIIISSVDQINSYNIQYIF
jgi:hypothetical protein